MDVMKQIEKVKLVPVTVFENKEQVLPVLESLVKGGVPITEICFRTECAEEAIKIASRDCKDILVGAGTVINKDQASKAIKAGAKFIVSPGFTEEVYEECKINNIPYLPGIVTPTEIMNALNHGINYVKFFPAGVFGGLKAIKALAAAFPQVKFMPTGGVDLTNLKEFVEYKNIFAIGGSFLLKGDIEHNCKEAVKIVKGE